MKNKYIFVFLILLVLAFSTLHLAKEHGTITNSIVSAINNFEDNREKYTSSKSESELKPLWIAEVQGIRIINAFFGDFHQGDPTNEISVALDNGTIIVYNYSSEMNYGQELGRFNFTWDPNKNITVTTTHFVEIDSSSGIVIFANYTKNLTFLCAKDFYKFFVIDLDKNGYRDLVVWNQTHFYVYLFKENDIVAKTITPNDFGFTSGQFISDGFPIWELAASSREIFLISIYNDTEIYLVLLKINTTSLVYNILDINVFHTTTSRYYDLYYLDSKFEDDYIEIGVEYYNVTTTIPAQYIYKVVFFAKDKSFTENNVTISLTKLTTVELEPLSYSLDVYDNDFWLKINDYNESTSYGQYLVRRIKDSPTTYKLVTLFFNRTSNQIEKATLNLYTFPNLFVIGNTDVQHKDMVDDIISFKKGSKELTIFPGSNLVKGKNTTIEVTTSTKIYDLKTLDIPTKREDLIITGEEGYIMVYFTPDFYVTYFDGRPAGDVIRLKKYNISGDGVFDFVAVYEDKSTNTYGVYVFISDGSPPIIQRIEIKPKHPTSVDYITVKVWTTDNLGIYAVFGFFTSLLIGQKHLEYFVVFQKSREGDYYYAELLPLRLFPVIADYNAWLYLFVRDLFGNEARELLEIPIYASVEVESYIPVFEGYNSAKSFEFLWSYDADRDYKEEAYVIATVNTSTSIGDIVFAYIEYSYTKPYNNTVTYNTTLTGKPVGGGVGLSDGNITVAVYVSEGLIDVYSYNLDTLYIGLSLSGSAVFARLSDFDKDGFDELIVAFANGTIKVFNIYPITSEVTQIISFNLPASVNVIDAIGLNNYLYVSYTNTTHYFIDVYNETHIITTILINSPHVYSKNKYVMEIFSNKMITLLANGTLLVFSGANIERYDTGTTFSDWELTESFITDDQFLYLADEIGGIHIYNSTFHKVYENKAIYGSLPYSLAVGRLENGTVKALMVVYLEKFVNFFRIDINETDYLQIFKPYPILGGDFDNYTEYEALLVFDKGVVFVHDIYKYYGLYPIITGLQPSYIQGQHITSYVELKNIFDEPIDDANIEAVFYTPDKKKLVYRLENIGGGRYELNVSTEEFIYGYYNLSLMINHDYYRDYIFNYTILLRPIINIKASYEYYARHGNELIIDLQIFDAYNRFLENAYGNVTINGTLRARIYYNDTTGFYEAKFNESDLYNLPLGVYGIVIEVNHPWAAIPASYASTLYLYSALKVDIQVSPRNITQGENFTVVVNVYDAANFSVENAYVEVSTDYYFAYGYTSSNGSFAVNIFTEFWDGGNKTISIYVDHIYAEEPAISESWIFIFAVPYLYFGYDYKDVGVDILYIDLVDRYSNILEDGVVVLEVEGKNYSLNDTGSFRVEFNFTKVALKRTFTIYFYVVNGTFTPETKFGPYTVDVKVGGLITVDFINAYNSSSPIYQGDLVNVTIMVTDSYGDPVEGLYDVTMYVFGQKYVFGELGDGYYYTLIDTYLWGYGAYSYQIEIYHDMFVYGVLTYRGEFVLLPYINIDVAFNPFEDSTTNVSIYLYDIYGFLLTNASVDVISTPFIVVRNSSSFNVYSVLLNGSMLVPDYYWLVVNISWDSGIWGVSYKTFNITGIPVKARVNISYIFSENASGVFVQGEIFQLNVTIKTSYGVTVDNALVVFQWMGSLKIASFSNGNYYDTFDTTGLSYGPKLLIINVFHGLLIGDLTIDLEVKILANPKTELFSIENFGNKSVLVEFRVTDAYGKQINEANAIVLFLLNKSISSKVSNGKAIFLLDFSKHPAGKYGIKLKISGDLVVSKEFSFDLVVKSLVKEEYIVVNALGLVTDETGMYPTDAIIQGEMLYINVSVKDPDGLIIPKTTVKVIFAGQTYFPTKFEEGYYIIQITTENMASGHYRAIIQIAGPYIISEEGVTITIEKLIYIKPEIHYKVELPETIIEGQEFNITVYLRDKYNNPLEPIENKTKVIIRFADKNYEAEYNPEQKAFTSTVTAPPVGEDEIVHSYDVTIFIDYEGTGIENAITTKGKVVVQATPPVTQSAVEENINMIWLITAVATIVSLVGYLLVRYQAFNEKLMRFLYMFTMFGTLGLFGLSIGLFGIREYGYAEVAVLLSFIGLFPWYSLQVRMDQIKMFKASYKAMLEDKEAKVTVNKLNYLVIYLFGAIAIYIAFEVIGSKILWFSRYVLAGLRVAPGLHYITAQTILFYLFAARGIYIRTVKHLQETIEKKLPSIKYATTLEDKMNLFTGIVEDSIKLTGTYAITTTVYTLYLLGTSIWGTSRLPAIGLSPLTLGLLLIPITIPILIIWLLRYIKLPGEATIETLKFEPEEETTETTLQKLDIEIINDINEE